MKPSAYLETTIISYLTAWPSRDLVTVADQEITRRWWESHRDEFDMYVSQPVVEEISAGDLGAAQRRLEALQGIPQLATTAEVNSLAKALFNRVPLPPRAQTDALHIAFAAVHGMNYLVTWNCSHIANAALRKQIEKICRDAGYEPPIICTPRELLENDDDNT